MSSSAGGEGGLGYADHLGVAVRKLRWCQICCETQSLLVSSSVSNVKHDTRAKLVIPMSCSRPYSLDAHAFMTLPRLLCMRPRKGPAPENPQETDLACLVQVRCLGWASHVCRDKPPPVGLQLDHTVVLAHEPQLEERRLLRVLRVAAGMPPMSRKNLVTTFCAPMFNALQPHHHEPLQQLLPGWCVSRKGNHERLQVPSVPQGLQAAPLLRGNADASLKAWGCRWC